MKKTIGLIALLAALALALTACGGSPVDGTWKLSDYRYRDEEGNMVSEMQSMIREGYGIGMVFKDGKVTITESYTVEGTYEAQDGQLLLHTDGYDETFAVEGDTLIRADYDSKMVFARQSAAAGLDGVWKMTDILYLNGDGEFVSEIESWTANGESIQMTFKDGKATVEDLYEAAGTYEVKDKQVVITINDSSENFTLDGNTLTFAGNDNEIVFTRQ